MSRFPNKSRNSALQRWMGYFCIALGLLLILSSFNGSWGKAYGQSVVTPTPGLSVGDPRITKVGEPGCCEPGDTVMYTIVATNVGTGDVTNILIMDTLPAELVLQDVTTSKGQVTINGNYFEVRISRISPGEIVTIVVRALVIGVPEDMVIRNTAYMRTEQGDREASYDIALRGEGGCQPPPILPPTGGPVPQEEGGTSPLLLLAGLFLLLVGIILTVRARKQSAEES
jgi:uncharacterized repeat protein (TIGR01451 family)